MASVKKYNMRGDVLGDVDLNDAVFAVEENMTVVHEAAVALQNAKRQGNHETKRRAEVSGGGRKPYRQKGTGNARHGSIREPQMKGGGTVFGPHKRSYRQHVPLAIRRKALSIVLTNRVANNKLCILDQLTLAAPKTKAMAEMMTKLSPEGRKTLIVTPSPADANALLSLRNLERVCVRSAADVNALDVLDAVRVIVTQDALATLEERLS